MASFVWISSFAKVGDKVQDTLGNAHVLSGKILWKIWHALH
jgi:hypothetical protein